MGLEGIPHAVRERYHLDERGHASAILASDYPNEFQDIMDCLEKFVLSYRDEEGNLVENDPRRFGFHNLRHSLASFLVRIKTDPKTVQALLRNSDVKFTLQYYTHSVSDDRMAAAGAMLTAILSS